jgi:two-component system sensor histidine kinase GlrK
MERAARQSLILGDLPLRLRYEDESNAASETLAQLVDAVTLARLSDGYSSQALNQAYNGLLAAAQDWQQQHERIRAIMGKPGKKAGPRSDAALNRALRQERAVAKAFRELDLKTQRLGQSVQNLITQNSDALRAKLARSQTYLSWLVVMAVMLTLGLAAGLGLWLARPLREIEHAIIGLGENQISQPIHIRGPSDVRAVGRQLDWLRLRLAELDADKARFLRHVSHELKTPLAALREGVALLEDGVMGQLTERQQEVAHILQQNVQSLQGQIEALLRFNAAAFEARQLKRRAVDLRALAQAQIEAQRLQWKARALRVRLEGEAPLLPLDEEKMGTAIANLLANAIRFSPPGGTIDMALSTHPGKVCLDIGDEGAGVAEEDRGRIFEPFYRGQRQPEPSTLPSTIRSSGIGLSIVREYVEAHGGRVTLLDYDETKGAHFRIELPYEI